jgi:6,7-dimethyl-8-ribityllumazine synthase
MPETIEGKKVPQGLRLGIVVSRFNEYITQHLLNGALKELAQHGVEDSQISVVWVPGAFEIPMAALKMAETTEYSAIITLGCIIRGSTPHFEYLSQAVSTGISEAQIKSGTPMAFGVITTETIEQAIERAGSKQGNKGREAAVCAIEMAQLGIQLQTRGGSKNLA